MWAIFVFEAGWLLAEVLFADVAVEEGVGDIQLVRRSLLGGDDGEDRPDGGWFYHRQEGLAEVDAWSLVEPAHHPPGFVAFKRAVGVELFFEDPLAGDDPRTWWPRNERPCSVRL